MEICSDDQLDMRQSTSPRETRWEPHLIKTPKYVEFKMLKCCFAQCIWSTNKYIYICILQNKYIYICITLNHFNFYPNTLFILFLYTTDLPGLSISEILSGTATATLFFSETHQIYVVNSCALKS